VSFDYKEEREALSAISDESTRRHLRLLTLRPRAKEKQRAGVYSTWYSSWRSLGISIEPALVSVVHLEPTDDRRIVSYSKHHTAMCKTKARQQDITLSKAQQQKGNFVSSHAVSAAHFHPADNAHNRTQVTFGRVLPCQKNASRHLHANLERLYLLE
jgi:hypothetical protein